MYVRGKVKPLAIGRKVILQKRYKKRSGPWRKGDANPDLTLYDPDWDTISETTLGPVTSGGVLDPTSTAGCGGPGSFERIYRPAEDAPVGRYHSYVSVKDACGATSTAWRLEIRVNGRLVNTVIGSGEKYGINFGGSGGW